MGYHKKSIDRGKYGEFSKIKEEFLEAEDAFEQDNKIMLLVELSDLIGSIEGFIEKYGLTLDDVIKMQRATKKAFLDGTRISKQK